MKVLDRYIARQVVGGTLLALAFLLAMLAFVSFVDDLKSVGRGDYTLYRALEYMVLILPRQAFALLPVSAVIGSLMGLGALAAGSELAVMRAAGISTVRLSWAVLKAAGLMVALALVVGEGLAPPAERLAQERRSLAISNTLSLQAGRGVWLRDGNRIVNVDKVLPDQRLSKVTIHELDDHNRLKVSIKARRARFVDGGWLLQDVRESRFDDDRVTARSMPELRWESKVRPQLISVVAVRPESLSALGLRSYIDYLEDNGLKTDRFELALWTKAAYPMATAVMILLGLPLVLGRFGRSGIGLRILVGALLGAGFHIFTQIAGHVGILYQLNPAACAFAPSVLFLAIGWWLMRRLTFG